MADKHITGCSTSLAIMVTKHIHRYQASVLDCIFFGGVIIQPTISNTPYTSLPLEQKMVTTLGAGYDGEKLDYSYIAGRKVK